MLTIKHSFGILWLTVHLFNFVYCSGGESSTFRKQDDHGNYKFGYDINDGYGGNHFHKESGDQYGNKYGSYGILGADGKMRIVHYIADEHGFRVDIKSNEQGIAHGKDSASAIVNGKDADEHSDYSSTYGQRTAGYSPIHSPAPLYLSSTSNHPASKPYYLNSLSSTIKSSTDPETYPVHHETPYIPIKPKTYQSPHYALAAKSYYPKNVAYIPKYNYPSSYHLSSYPKPKAYEAPSYSSSYKSPTYTTGSSYGSTSYGNNYEPTKEPIDYPIPVHKPTYSAHDYGNNVYDSPVYGTRKTSYVSDLYSKSAEPVLTYAKLSGYSSKKHNEKMKYFNEPYEQSPPTVSSSSSTSGQDTSSSAVPLDTAIDNLSTVEKKREDEEIANDYRTESKNGVISTKPTTGIIGLTSYRNPYSIDTEYKSS